jgi:putative transposase
VIRGVGNSTQTSCKLAGISKSTYYYRPIENPINTEITERLKELASERPRFGSLRLTVLLRKEYGNINHKRIQRLYKQAGLNLPRKPKKRKWLGRRQPLNKPVTAYERWSMI